VQIVTATFVERADAIEAGGLVAASESAVVSSRVAAPVTFVAVRAGDRVRAGDVLLRLDTRDLTARVQQADAGARAADNALSAARSSQAAAEAERKLAAAWHSRISQLHERNSATAQEFDEAEARLTAATARVSAAQSEVDRAVAQLASMRAGADIATVTETYATIRAPFDGEVTERSIDPGNLALPGQPLLQLDAAGRRRVDVRVDEARAPYIHAGDRAAVMLDDAHAHGGAGTPIEGTVVEIARAVAVDQRAFTVKVALPSAMTLRTGTFARVRFEGARRRALIVPAACVRSQGQLRSVFVVSNGVAHIRLVQTGDVNPDGVEIISGLDAGEMVVVSAPAELTDGRTVVIESSPVNGASP
jgi:RND family efflux transporter MFP subunit